MIFDGQGQGTIWSVGVDTINIYGLTFKNGGESYGGALYFLNDVSNSVINATFINNSVNLYGGAIYVGNSVSNLTLRSTFINNTANEYGAAVYIKSTASNLILNSTFIGNTADNCGACIYIGGNADNVNVYGEYRNNTASQGGVIYANKTFSSSVIDATFINNTAKSLGGALCFNGALTGVDISGKFINNTGGDSLICVVNSVSYNSIQNSIFLNNEAYKIITVYNGEITATDNWFGSDASNYYKIPEDVGIDLENWLFLNATADPSELAADEKSTIIFKLSSFDGSEIIDYDASKMNIVLDLSQTLGQLDKNSSSIGETITYTAKEGGNATVTGKFETASYAVSLTNNDNKIPTSINVTNSTVDLKVNDEIPSGASLIPADAGNLTYTSSNSSVAVVENGKIKALAAGSAIITVSFAGDDSYSAAENKTIEVTVSLKDASVSVNNATLDLLIDDEFIVVVTTNPEGLDVTFTPDNSGVVSVDENGVVSALKEGNATVKVSVGGDDVYVLNATDVTVTVKKIPTEIIANDTLDMHIGDVASNVAVLEPITGDNLTYISSNPDVVKVEEGKLVAVANGTATITVTYAGDDKYAPSNATVTVKVSKLEIKPEIKQNYTTLTVEVPSDAAGNVTVTIGNETITAPIEEGIVVIDLSDVLDGDYNATVSYPGDSKYSGFDVVVPVSIGSEFQLIAENLTKYYHGVERFAVMVVDSKGNPISGTEVKILINGMTYTRITDENGSASMAINLESGEYIATVSCNNTTVESTVTVLTTVNGTDLVKIFRNATQYYATFCDSEGNYLKNGTVVRFNIRGIMYDRKVSGDEGLAKLNINLEQGEYIVTAINLVTGESHANNITVLPRIVENYDLTKYYRNASQYTVKIISDDGKAMGAGENVTFNINGALYTRITNESGIAKLNINLQPGDYVITAEYKNCRVYSNIKVLPVLTAQDLTKKYGTKDQFVASLVDGQGKVYAGQSIQFNINGVFYYRTTDSNGHAKLNINLQPGEYIITSSYNGANIGNKITVTA